MAALDLEAKVKQGRLPKANQRIRQAGCLQHGAHYGNTRARGGVGCSCRYTTAVAFLYFYFPVHVEQWLNASSRVA
jgi:hypothetical protein